MRFPETGTAVYKQRIVGAAGRLAYRNAACVGKTVAGPYHEIIEDVVRMQFRLNTEGERCILRLLSAENIKIDTDQMARQLLSGPREAVFAVITQILHGRLIGAAYFEGPAAKTQYRQFIKPRAIIDRVESFHPLDYVRENIFNFLCCHRQSLMNQCSLQTATSYKTSLHK